MLSYEHFRKAVKNLEVQHQNLLNLDTEQPPLVQEAVKESVIQRFEICADLSWKALRTHLREELGLADTTPNPKDTFQAASENKLLRSTAEVWFGYVDARNATSHDYDGEKAKAVLGMVGDFLDDAIDLYQTLSGETWE